MSPINQPIIKKVQAFIDARALKIGGIFYLLRVFARLPFFNKITPALKYLLPR